jgi:hypothetical protein
MTLLLDLGGFSGTMTGGGGVRTVSSSALSSSEPGTTDKTMNTQKVVTIHTVMTLAKATTSSTPVIIHTDSATVTLLRQAKIKTATFYSILQFKVYIYAKVDLNV